MANFFGNVATITSGYLQGKIDADQARTAMRRQAIQDALGMMQTRSSLQSQELQRQRMAQLMTGFETPGEQRLAARGETEWGLGLEEQARLRQQREADLRRQQAAGRVSGLLGAQLGLTGGPTGEMLTHEPVEDVIGALGLQQPLTLPSAPGMGMQLAERLPAAPVAPTPTFQRAPTELTAPWSELTYEQRAPLVAGRAGELGAPLEFGPQGFISGIGQIPTETDRAIDELQLRVLKRQDTLGQLDVDIARDPKVGRKRAAEIKAAADEDTRTLQKLKLQVAQDPNVGTRAQSEARIAEADAAIDNIYSQIDEREYLLKYGKPPTTALYGPTEAEMAKTVYEQEQMTKRAQMQHPPGGAAGPAIKVSASEAKAAQNRYRTRVNRYVDDPIYDFDELMDSLNAERQAMGQYFDSFWPDIAGLVVQAYKKAKLANNTDAFDIGYPEYANEFRKRLRLDLLDVPKGLARPLASSPRPAGGPVGPAVKPPPGS